MEINRSNTRNREQKNSRREKRKNMKKTRKREKRKRAKDKMKKKTNITTTSRIMKRQSRNQGDWIDHELIYIGNIIKKIKLFHQTIIRIFLFYGSI